MTTIRLSLGRLIGFLTAVMAGLLLYNPKIGAFQGLAWGPKLVASALAPLTAIFGGLVALWGLRRKDIPSVVIGGLSAAIAAKNVMDITAPREDNFAAVFGPDWRDHIPPDLQARLRPYRYRPYYRRRSHGPMHRNVVFGQNTDTGRPLRADMLQPPPGVACTGLAMIFVHGGGWWYGKKDITKFPFFQRLVFQGHVVMDIDYTLAPHSSLLGMVKDVKQAILWLKAHADTFQVNPERIVLTGQSAGGQLSLLAAYTPNQPEFQPPHAEGDTSVRGVISYQGPPDLTALYYDIEGRFIRLIPNQVINPIHRLLELVTGHRKSLASGIAGIVGGTPNDVPELYRRLSPISHVSDACVPTLLLQGNHDLLVSHKDVERFYNLMKQANAPVIYIPFPNCNHAFEAVLPRLSPPAQVAAYYTERFLALLV